MHKELKKAIIDFLFENENLFQRTNGTVNHFKQYIYTEKGEHCIGGKEVYDFIRDAEKLLYKK